jgi:dipeptidyl aminopeptidase/acylaminoacyl peptidase
VFYQKYDNGAAKGEPKDIMAGEKFDSPMNPFGGSSEICWSHDGKKIFYTCKKLSGKDYAVSTNSEIYIHNIESGVTENMSIGLDGYDKEPQVSPNGRYLAWNSMERAGYESDRNQLFLFDNVEKKRIALTYDIILDINHPRFSEDETTLYFISGKEATEQIFSLDIKTRKVTQITEGDYNYTGYELAGKDIIATRQSISSPTEIYRVNAKSGKAEQITFENRDLLKGVDMGKVEGRWITTHDGLKMKVWVIYPPDFDPSKKYPALLYCQGGPQSAVSQFFSTRWNFQLMAANGYIVVAPNRRGLPGFGMEWLEEISKDWGGKNMLDYLTAIDTVAAEPYVDRDRLGAVGASYGGYSVYWLAGHHQDRFKALIAHCGLFNLESWYGATEEMFFANWDIGGPYWDTQRARDYNAFSPHRFVKDWDTPILVIHGEKDFRVPIGEGMQAFQAAQLQDIPSRFLYFPEEGHWVQSPQNSILWHRVFFDWLDRWLKEEGN